MLDKPCWWGGSQLCEWSRSSRPLATLSREVRLGLGLGLGFGVVQKNWEQPTCTPRASGDSGRSANSRFFFFFFRSSFAQLEKKKSKSFTRKDNEIKWNIMLMSPLTWHCPVECVGQKVLSVADEEQRQLPRSEAGRATCWAERGAMSRLISACTRCSQGLDRTQRAGDRSVQSRWSFLPERRGCRSRRPCTSRRSQSSPSGPSLQGWEPGQGRRGRCSHRQGRASRCLYLPEGKNCNVDW